MDSWCGIALGRAIIPQERTSRYTSYKAPMAIQDNLPAWQESSIHTSEPCTPSTTHMAALGETQKPHSSEDAGKWFRGLASTVNQLVTVEETTSA